MPSSPAGARPLHERLSAADARRAAIGSLKAASLSERLAKLETVKTKKEELASDKAAKTKEELEAKQEKTEEKRLAQLGETRDKLADHLARVERAQRDLEIQTEAARLAAEFAFNAKMLKAEENKDEHLETMLKKINDHKVYVTKVRANQESKLKPYFAELEVNIKEKLTIAEKRREEVIEKVVAAAKEDSRKAELVRENKARLQVRVSSSLSTARPQEQQQHEPAATGPESA
jgi:hypothetical protein